MHPTAMPSCFNKHFEVGSVTSLVHTILVPVHWLHLKDIRKSISQHFALFFHYTQNCEFLENATYQKSSDTFSTNDRTSITNTTLSDHLLSHCFSVSGKWKKFKIIKYLNTSLYLHVSVMKQTVCVSKMRHHRFTPHYLRKCKMSSDKFRI